MNIVFKYCVTILLITIVNKSECISKENNVNDTAELLWELSNLAVQSRQNNFGPSYGIKFPGKYPEYYQETDDNQGQYGLPPYAGSKYQYIKKYRPYPEYNINENEVIPPDGPYPRPPYFGSGYPRPPGQEYLENPHFGPEYPQTPYPGRPNPQKPHYSQVPNYPGPQYPGSQYRPKPPFYRPQTLQNLIPTREKIMDALDSVARNDDLQCVPKLLCEVTSGTVFGARQQSFGLPFNVNMESLIGLLSVLPSQTNPLIHFGKAALLGYSGKGSSTPCNYAYPNCPNDPDRLIKYLNNHNGGFFRYFNGIMQQGVLPASYQPHGYPPHPYPSPGYRPNGYGYLAPGYSQTPPGYPQITPGYPQIPPGYPQNYGNQYPYNSKTIEQRIQNKPGEYITSNNLNSVDNLQFSSNDGQTSKLKFPNNQDFNRVENTNFYRGENSNFQTNNLHFPNGNNQNFNINSYTRDQKALKFPLDTTNWNSIDPPFRKPEELPYGIDYYYNPNQNYDNLDLDFQKPLPNHVASPVIFPLRTGTGELKLDEDEINKYRPQNNINFNSGQDFYSNYNFGTNQLIQSNRGGFLSINVEVLNKEVLVMPGQNATFMCRIPNQLQYCRVELSGSTKAENLVPGRKDKGITYVGDGLQSGQCGFNIHRVEERYNGRLKCTLGSLDDAEEYVGTMELIVAKQPRAPELHITPNPDNPLEYRINDELRASCVVRDGRPVANITWYLGDEQLYEGLSMPLIQDLAKENWQSKMQNLSRVLQASDNGKALKCVAYHPAYPNGFSETQLLLNIKYPPLPLASSTDLYGYKIGQFGPISVEIEANPKPRVEWTIDGQKITEGKEDDTGRIRAENIRDLGNGKYQVNLNIARINKVDTEKDYILTAYNDKGTEHYTIKIFTSPEPEGLEMGLGPIIGIVLALAIVFLISALLIFAKVTGRWCFSGGATVIDYTNGESGGHAPSDVMGGGDGVDNPHQVSQEYINGHGTGRPLGESSDTESTDVRPKEKKRNLPPLKLTAFFTKNKDKVGTEDVPETKQIETEEVKVEIEKTSEPKEGLVYAELDLLVPNRTVTPVVKKEEEKTEYAEIFYPAEEASKTDKTSKTEKTPKPEKTSPKK